MELKKHLKLWHVLVIAYYIFFAIYIIVGLQPAGAVEYDISNTLSIPGIDLISDVTSLSVSNGELDTPDTIVGSYTQSKNKTLLIGHSTTVFEHLADVMVSDEVIYGGNSYTVISRFVTTKTDISMDEILRPEDKDTLVLMTCAGELLPGGDATHRLILLATRN